MTPETGPGAADFLRVVRGLPTDEELAAVVVVLASRRSAAPGPPPAVDGWSAYWRSIGAPLTPGPGAWQASQRVR